MTEDNIGTDSTSVLNSNNSESPSGQIPSEDMNDGVDGSEISEHVEGPDPILNEMDVENDIQCIIETVHSTTISANTGTDAIEQSPQTISNEVVDTSTCDKLESNVDGTSNKISSNKKESNEGTQIGSGKGNIGSRQLSSLRSFDKHGKSKKRGTHKVQIGTSENPLDVTNLPVDCSSLLDLYQNEYFDAYMHMYHLYHKKEPGIHEYLVNMLYSKRTNDEILFYLPQLCQLSISRYGKSSLHRFLLDRSSTSMYFALQLSWFYQGAIEDQLPKLDHLSQKMAQETEMAVVNCKLISPIALDRPASNIDVPRNVSLPSLLDRRLFIRSLTRRCINDNQHLYDVCTDVNSLLSPQMPHSLVHNTFTLSCPLSKVRLMAVHTKLGNPLDFETHPIFDCGDDMQVELQKLMMKQRRLNYFNSLNHFVSLCMEVSIRLTTEPKRDLREPLLKVFANALNEWMLLRRCTVAAYEESFLYTGLSFPFKSISSLKTDQGGYQIIRVVESEIKIFYSRKRTPFVFYLEIANLDEDIEEVAKRRNELIAVSGNDDRLGNFPDDSSMKHLYVLDAIVEDLVTYDLLNPSQIAVIKNPLECIRYALGMLPPESIDRYKDALTKPEPDSPDKDEESVPMSENTENANVKVTVAADESDHLVERSSFHGLDTFNRSDSKNTSSRSNSMSNVRFPNLKALSPDEVRAIVWPETLVQKRERIRRTSPYGHLKTWDIRAFIIKGGDDLRQERMVQQIILLFVKIFKKANLPLWLKPIEILVTGANSGILEYLHDTSSVDVVKRRFNIESIALAFEKLFASNIYEARKNFIESHAAYSIVSYLLQVKDRHNGNIMLDSQGHVIHIDYGFCLSNSPGNINFETSPFKLTKEYVDIIGGATSDNFDYFRTLVIKGLLESRKYVDQIVLLVEMMSTASKMPCFAAGTTYTIESFRERFMLNHSEESCIKKITDMVDGSVNNFRTVQYDNFQRLTNGIL